MQHAREMTNAVDIALQRLRGEFAALEQAVEVLRDSVSEEGMTVGPQQVGTDSINHAGKGAEGDPQWKDISQAVLGQLRLPQYGALPPPDYLE